MSRRWLNEKWEIALACSLLIGIPWVAITTLMSDHTARLQHVSSEQEMPQRFRELPRPESFIQSEKPCFDLRRKPNVHMYCEYISTQYPSDIESKYHALLNGSHWKQVSAATEKSERSDGVTVYPLISAHDGTLYFHVSWVTGKSDRSANPGSGWRYILELSDARRL